MRAPLEFFVQGIPHAQPRVKATSRGKFASVYTPKGKHDDWKTAVRASCLEHWEAKCCDVWQGPLRVDLTFYFPRPKSHHRANGEVKPGAPLWHCSKPDRDNADKLILDTLTQLGLWPDDKAVCDGRIRKFYSDATRPCGCVVRVSEAAQ